MWSLNGSSIFFPENSAMTVGGSSPIQLLVLQVHYIDNSKIPKSGDSSGVLVHYSSKKPKYNVGIFSLHHHGVVNPRGFSNWDSACSLKIEGDQPVLPFAFLTHTHSLGVDAEGWLIQSKKWNMIGQSNPQVGLKEIYTIWCKSLGNFTPDDVRALGILHHMIEGVRASCQLV